MNSSASVYMLTDASFLAVYFYYKFLEQESSREKRMFSHNITYQCYYLVFRSTQRCVSDTFLLLRTGGEVVVVVERSFCATASSWDTLHEQHLAVSGRSDTEDNYNASRFVGFWTFDRALHEATFGGGSSTSWGDSVINLCPIGSPRYIKERV